MTGIRYVCIGVHVHGYGRAHSLPYHRTSCDPRGHTRCIAGWKSVVPASHLVTPKTPTPIPVTPLMYVGGGMCVCVVRMEHACVLQLYQHPMCMQSTIWCTKVYTCSYVVMHTMHNPLCTRAHPPPPAQIVYDNNGKDMDNCKPPIDYFRSANLKHYVFVASAGAYVPSNVRVCLCMRMLVCLHVWLCVYVYVYVCTCALYMVEVVAIVLLVVYVHPPHTYPTHTPPALPHPTSLLHATPPHTQMEPGHWEGDLRKASAGHVEVEKYLGISGLPWTVFQPLYIYGEFNAKDCEQWFLDRIMRYVRVWKVWVGWDNLRLESVGGRMWGGMNECMCVGE